MILDLDTLRFQATHPRPSLTGLAPHAGHRSAVTIGTDELVALLDIAQHAAAYVAEAVETNGNCPGCGDEGDGHAPDCLWIPLVRVLDQHLVKTAAPAAEEDGDDDIDF